MTHAFFADMGGFVLQTKDYTTSPLTSRQLYFLVKERYLQFPHTTEQEIRDKNKAESFVRIITTIQIFSFLLNSIVHTAQHFGMTTLELNPLALHHVYLCHKLPLVSQAYGRGDTSDPHFDDADERNSGTPCKESR